MGRPMLGCVMMGRCVSGRIRCTRSTNVLGDVEQLMPSTSTPSAVSVTAAISGVEPVRVRPEASKVMVAKSGRSVFSRTARTAARIS